MKQSYCGMESKKWAEITALNERCYRAPFSVHLPLHPPCSKTFVYMDCAANAYTLPVLPDVKTGAPGLKEMLAGIETMIVQFAFDNPAFVPDFRLSRIELAEGRYPLIKLSYFAWNLFYQIEYFCARADAGNNVLWIKVAVTNEDTVQRDACVRVKVNFQKEKQLFDYHYVPFYWDAGKWRPDDSVALADDGRLQRGGSMIGRIKSSDLDWCWEDELRFTDDEYNKSFKCSAPYFVQPCMRLKEAQGLLKFSGALAPGESKSFVMALFTEHTGLTSAQEEQLTNDSEPAARRRALDAFKAAVESAAIAQLTLTQADLGNVFAALQTSNYQMLIDFGKGRGLQPCQGGSSERFYVWVWEAMCMLLPMLQLGHFKPVKRAVDFVFDLQDGGTPPDGNFTSLAGAVGTTGPRWMNATGSALALAAEYYRYAHDKEFLQKYLDKMLRAAYWIIGEIRATRKLDPDGSRPPVYGLLPFGRATDGDIGYIVGFSDAYSYYGLEKFARLLAEAGHPGAVEVAEEVAQYKTDLNRAIDRMRRPDGFIDRKIVLEGDNSRIARGFDNICGAQIFAFTNIISAHDRRFREYAEYFKKNKMREFFTGAMNRDVMYIGNAEHLWQHAWLCMGWWKHAYTALQTNLKYGMSADAYLTQERFSLSDPAYTPWQPNSSGNGRMLDMLVKQFYFEYEDDKYGCTTVFFGGMPPAWFAINAEMSLNGLYTPAGRISVATAGMAFKITCEGFSLRARTIRIPEYFTVAFDVGGVENMGGGYFKIKQELRVLSGRFKAAEEI